MVVKRSKDVSRPVVESKKPDRSKDRYHRDPRMIKDLPKGPNGRRLCRQCDTEVPKGRRSFCSEECVHEYRIRSDGQYLRNRVYARDKGICARCGMDAEKVYRVMMEMKSMMNDRLWPGRPWPEISKHRLSVAIDKMFPQGAPWNADHIVEVQDGGGASGLENIQTLCYWCHLDKTAEEREKRKLRKKNP